MSFIDLNYLQKNQKLLLNVRYRWLPPIYYDISTCLELIYFITSTKNIVISKVNIYFFIQRKWINICKTRTILEYLLSRKFRIKLCIILNS